MTWPKVIAPPPVTLTWAAEPLLFRVSVLLEIVKLVDVALRLTAVKLTTPTVTPAAGSAIVWDAAAAPKLAMSPARLGALFGPPSYGPVSQAALAVAFQV